MTETAVDNSFLISFDASKMNPSEIESFLTFIKYNRLISDWHSPFIGCIIVNSNNDAQEIADAVNDYIDEAVSIYVSEVVEGRNAGYLPPETWKFLKKLGFRSHGKTEEQ